MGAITRLLVDVAGLETINGLLGRERTRLCSAIQKEFVLELAVVHVTTRIVLRVKKVVRLSAISVKTKCRAIANAVVLHYESFTSFSHPRIDNNFFHRVALVFVDVLLQHN